MLSAVPAFTDVILTEQPVRVHSSLRSLSRTVNGRIGCRLDCHSCQRWRRLSANRRHTSRMVNPPNGVFPEQQTLAPLPCDEHRRLLKGDAQVAGKAHDSLQLCQSGHDFDNNGVFSCALPQTASRVDCCAVKITADVGRAIEHTNLIRESYIQPIDNRLLACMLLLSIRKTLPSCPSARADTRHRT